MAIATAAAVVSATAGLYGAYRAHESAEAGVEEQDKIRAARIRQSKDILEQIGSEEIVYEDELDMIKKQTQLAESKLDLSTSQSVEGLGEEVGAALTNLVGKSKYGGGASKRATAELEGKYDEGLSDIKESYDMSMDELALRDEQAERDAFLRHEEIMGSLEAQRQELIA